MRDIDLFQAKQMLRPEQNGIARVERSELGLKVTKGYMEKYNRSKGLRNKFTGTCFGCETQGHERENFVGRKGPSRMIMSKHSQW